MGTKGLVMLERQSAFSFEASRLIKTDCQCSKTKSMNGVIAHVLWSNDTNLVATQPVVRMGPRNVLLVVWRLIAAKNAKKRIGLHIKLCAKRIEATRRSRGQHLHEDCSCAMFNHVNLCKNSVSIPLFSAHCTMLKKLPNQ